ncbi:MAG: Ig-like domain-containing protein [Bacteroidaceae bacterium]|nr:Ig-like domain-containing protein [Bacteroidaceae bacterium]
MKQNLLKKSLLLLLALVVGTGTSWAADYVKITSTNDLEDGQYLIVCGNQNVAFNGGLTTLDATSNTISVTISNNKIAVNNTTTAAEFTISAITDGYSIKSASGKFIGRTANSNGLNSGTTAMKNTISFDNSGNAVITGSGTTATYLQYNKTSGQTRFRYFTGSQTAIQLYKKEDSRTAVATINGITPNTVNWKTTDAFTLDATFATGLTASDYTITWKSSDDTKLELADEIYESKSSTGNVTVTVTITPNDDENYKEVSKDFTISIVDPRLVVNMTGFSADATTLSVNETTNTTVTNDQPGWTAAYTYSSDNENIATVDANGVITAIAVGDAKITATLNIPAEDTGYKAGSTTSKTIDITVTDAAIYTATFMVNGVEFGTQTAASGATFAFPVATASIGGLSFAGWSKTNVSPSLVNTSTETMSANTTYYAVYGKIASTVEDELTTSTFGSPTNYTKWSGTYVNTAVYAGESSGGTNYIQIRTTSPSGIVSTTSGGQISKVSVVWNSSTASGRTLDIYGKNSAYSTAEDLYGDAAGTKLGSVVYGTSTDYFVGGGYDYVGLRSNSGAMYLDKITITWAVIDPATYTTSIPSSVTVGTAGYTTYVTPAAVNFDGVTAYIATQVNAESIHLEEVTSAPANTAVVIKAPADTYDFTSTDSPADVSENILLVSTGTVKGNGSIYALGNKSGIGFYKVKSGETIPAGKAYINTAANPVKGFFDFNFNDDTPTGVESVKNVENGVMFNLAGQRVNKATKGIFIVNGKKVVR